MKLGITGGIGSGKSYVCRLLQQHGLHVFDCDSQAKRLMRESPLIRQRLTALIGPDTYTADGQLNKAAVAQYLLQSPSHAQAINAIVHPAVFEAFRQSGLPLIESAILFESGARQLVDQVVVVTAPQEVSLQRVMQRDHISRQQAQQWMSRQLPQETLIAKADIIIVNDGHTDLEHQIQKIITLCNKQF